jgi:hypothetical protein
MMEGGLILFGNNTQINAALERFAVVALGYAVGKGWIAPEDVTTYAAAFVAVVSAGLAIWNNRSKRLAEKTAAAGMTVIAPPQIADNTKSSAVVSSAEYSAQPK